MQERAIGARGGAGAVDLAGLVHHTDAGSQGGIDWSSQHLDCEELRWEHGGGVGRIGRGGLRCSRPLRLTTAARPAAAPTTTSRLRGPPQPSRATPHRGGYPTHLVAIKPGGSSTPSRVSDPCAAGEQPPFEPDRQPLFGLNVPSTPTPGLTAGCRLAAARFGIPTQIGCSGSGWHTTATANAGRPDGRSTCGFHPSG